MASEPFKGRIQFKDRDAKRAFIQMVNGWNELKEVSAKNVRPVRSNNANAYYHAAVVEAFRKALAAQGQHFTHDQCHEYLRDRFLVAEPITNAAGEHLGYMPASSAKLNTSEFYDYVLTCSEWVYDTFGWDVERPEDYGVSAPSREAARA